MTVESPQAFKIAGRINRELEALRAGIKDPDLAGIFAGTIDPRQVVERDKLAVAHGDAD